MGLLGAYHGISRRDSGEACLSDALDLVLAEFRETIHNAFNEAAETWQTVSAEYQIKRPDGVVRWLRVIINMTTFVGVDEPVCVAVFSDITVEKESADRLRFLNDTAHDILAHSDNEQAIRDTPTGLLSDFSDNAQ